jgi:DNA gyrase inhibitor GyrI
MKVGHLNAPKSFRPKMSIHTMAIDPSNKNTINENCLLVGLYHVTSLKIRILEMEQLIQNIICKWDTIL